MQATRFRMIIHHYIFFRDGQTKRWNSFGLQDLYMKKLRTQLRSGGGGEDNATTNNTGRPCSHCKSRFHAGGKNKCFWKNLSATEAKAKALETAQNLGVGLNGAEG